MTAGQHSGALFQLLDYEQRPTSPDSSTASASVLQTQSCPTSSRKRGPVNSTIETAPYTNPLPPRYLPSPKGLIYIPRWGHEAKAWEWEKTKSAPLPPGQDRIETAKRCWHSYLSCSPHHRAFLLTTIDKILEAHTIDRTWDDQGALRYLSDGLDWWTQVGGLYDS